MLIRREEKKMRSCGSHGAIMSLRQLPFIWSEISSHESTVFQMEDSGSWVDSKLEGRERKKSEIQLKRVSQRLSPSSDDWRRCPNW